MSPNAATDTVRNLDSRLEPFVDDWLIDRMRDVRLELHSPVPRETALDFDRPWEGPESYDPVVIKEGERYRMWYRACGEVWNDQCTAYAESDDGIHWHRPNLGIHTFQGSRENNIAIEKGNAKAVCVFRDANPEAPADEIYKAIGIGERINKRTPLRGFTSRDGLHWTLLDQDPITVAPPDPWPMFDSHNIAFWDPNQGQYVIYARGWLPPGVRSIRRSRSADFRSWTDFEFIDLGGTPVEHLYKNSCAPYFRAPHIYLMFPKRFVPERQFRPDWQANGISDAVFMSSRDGMRWDRRFMEAFLRPGPDPDNWTDRNIYIGPTLVPTGPSELSLYFVEHYRHPTARLRRATLRPDGFCSVRAGYAGGELVTHPLTFAGDELVVNYSTSAVGSLQVEIQDVSGRPLDGHALSECPEIYGDQIERVVSWQQGAGVGALAGQRIRLRFALRDADLYALQFRPPTS